MKITKIRIHNFRSIIDADIEGHDFLIFVGANNAGKSNIINALRCFYEDIKWTNGDFPKIGTNDQDSWVEITFRLSDNEWANLADKYKIETANNSIVLKRYFKGNKVKEKQSNIFAIVNGIEEDSLFYGAKNVSTAKCGNVIYIPALTTPNEQMKVTGPSPLRNMLHFMLKKVVAKSAAYNDLESAFGELNKEANKEQGFLSEIVNPINSALNQWSIKIDLSVNSISPEEIVKSLIKCTFIDTLLDDVSFDLDRFGHGFQRSVIYELIRISPSFQDDKKTDKKEFDPDFTLILFEEPEAFLHPSQQENMSYHLRRLGHETEQQVIITSHSPIFIGKNANELSQICRVWKSNGISVIYQIRQADEEMLVKSGSDFLAELQRYIDDPSIEQAKKKEAQKFVDSAPDEEIAYQYEKFRLQLWLDSERALMFFSDKVVLVEGATEKALFNYLLANNWYELTKERIFIVEAFGKYNFHRFIKLFSAYGIHHGIIFDGDGDNNEHFVINNFIRKQKTEFTIAEPFAFDKNLETQLGLSLPTRNDQKPLQILRGLEDKSITDDMLKGLRKIFCDVLAIH